MPAPIQEHASKFLTWLLNPATLATIGTYSSLLTVAGRWVWRKLEAKQDKDIESIRNDVSVLSKELDDQLKAIRLDQVRLQILSGVSTGILSTKEVSDLYDIYKASGGNSYVSRIVADYLEEKI